MENYLRVVRQVADNLGLSLVIKDDGWYIYFVDRYGNEFDMIMFDLGLNSSLTVLKASDKSRCSSMLIKKGVPALRHHFYAHSRVVDPGKSLIEKLEEMHHMLFEHGSLVLKPNDGGAGRDVYKVDHVDTLDRVVMDMFSRNINIAVSPYREFEVEYRVVVLDGEVQMSFGKKRGDDFKHNLSAGSGVVDVPEHLKNDLHDLAIRAAKAVGARFVSVDIFESSEGLVVLEVNGTVTLKRVSEASDEMFDKSVKTYQRALSKVMDEYYNSVYSK